MSGLVTWDAQGRQIIGENDRLNIIQASIITTSGVAGSRAIELNGTEQPWIQVHQMSRIGYNRPNVTLNGNIVSWSAAQDVVQIDIGTF